MFVKPAPGLKIRDPLKKDYLPTEGREIDEHDLYWHRLLMDEDVIEVKADPAKSSGKKPAPDPT